MSKSTISTFQLFEMFPDQETARTYLESRLWPEGPKCPVCGLGERITARKGELATRKQFFGENRRYAVAPIHTRFDALEWFVWDAEHPLSDLNHAEVIRQAETLEEALRGL